MASNLSQGAPAQDWIHVESMDLNAQGIAQLPSGKVVFIEGALPGEVVRVQSTRSKARWESAKAVQWQTLSPQRVAAACQYFGVCGGCSMQHLHVDAQLAIKQRALEDTLWHVGRLRPEQLLRPIAGPSWQYRGRGRLTVRVVPKKGGVLIGFHEKKSSFVADMKSCHIVPRALSNLLPALRGLIAGMSQPDRLPQIEFAVTKENVSLVLRHLEKLEDTDLQRLRAFAQQHNVTWWLQANGPDSVVPLDEAPVLRYTLPEFDLSMAFRPTDFTQVNQAVNQVLVSLAVRELQLTRQSRVIDWFCGLGNFTLAIARGVAAGQVCGIEGSELLVQRSRENARANGLEVRFEACNLFSITAQQLLALPAADRWLLDPPREGALQLLQALLEGKRQPGFVPPQRIVYISCNPATLARDLSFAANQLGYRVVRACAINMFPHTSHVESMAVLEATHVASVALPSNG